MHITTSMRASATALWFAAATGCATATPAGPVVQLAPLREAVSRRGPQADERHELTREQASMPTAKVTASSKVDPLESIVTVHAPSSRLGDTMLAIAEAASFSVTIEDVHYNPAVATHLSA